MADKERVTADALPIGTQWAVADNLMYRSGALQSRPGITRVSAEMSLREGGAMTLSRDTMPVTDSTGAVRQRRTVCFVDAGKKYATVRTGALYSDGSFAEDGASSLVSVPDTTVMCVPCARDAVTDTLLYTGNGEIFSAGGGILLDEQSSIRVPVVWSGGRGAVSLQAERPTAGYAAEAPNLLTSQFEARYTADDTGCVFYLPFGDIDSTLFTVTVRDVSGTVRRFTVAAGASVGEMEDDGLALHVDRAVGRFWFVKGGVPVPPPLYGEQDNVRATGRKASLTRGGLVYGCAFGSWFGEPGKVADGGRLFVSGNPRYPNTVCCSAVGDPFYFPDNTVYALGRSREAVTAFARQGNALIVFKEHALFGVSYGSVDKAGFPIACLHEQVGCDCPQSAVLMDGRLIWATAEGIIWRLKSVDGENRCTLERLSDGFADTLCAVSAADWREAVACETEGHYFVAVGSQGFWLTDPETPVWYRWKWSEPFRVLSVCARGKHTGLLMTDGAGNLWGCALSGDADGLSVLQTPVTVTADTGLLYADRLLQRHALQMQLYLDGQADMTPYDEHGDGDTVSVNGEYDRLPIHRAGGRRFGLRITAQAPFALYCGQLFCRS